MIHIGGRGVGEGQPPLLVAEIAQAHDGSLALAHSFIDAVADAGAGAVKFQTHLAEHESTRDEVFRVAFPTQDATRYDYWRRMEFSPAQWRDLAEHASSRDLIFLSSAFSVAAVDLLEDMGMPAWKVGSGEVGSMDLLERMARTRSPVLLSTGMSSWQEIESAVKLVREHEAPLAILQCTSRYPSPLERVGLNVLDELSARFGCPVGLSDHSASVFPCLAAAARGAAILEVHVTFDRNMFGPDASASLTMDELQLLANGLRAFHLMDSHPVDKDTQAHELSNMRTLFNKSLAPRRRLQPGTILTAEMLTTKKPGTGIPPAEMASVVGQRLRRAAEPDRLLRREDLEPALVIEQPGNSAKDTAK